MFNARLGIPLAVAALAGCTAASGPTHTNYAVTLPDGGSAHRVTCYGLLENSNTCVKEAESICKDQPVRLLQGEALSGSTSGGRPDDRNILFECGDRTPQPASVPTSVPAVTLPPTVIVLSGDAYFDTAQATLTPLARVELDRLIEEAKGVSINSVAVYGYTDSVGSADYNQALSERRAAAVATYLNDHGLMAKKFAHVGYGKEHPIDTNATPEGRARNRRVEVFLDLDKS
ncbi:OmpA family protein [Paraburkholderia sp. J12]|uniref:OmpA family protein n=1 Tax=Paraburkholderia sp. J12 TaxID=2805432 RepID=UPI002ABDF16E|nr:OmpA family protein [Paraburkholderia sp. J12]